MSFVWAILVTVPITVQVPVLFHMAVVPFLYELPQPEQGNKGKCCGDCGGGEEGWTYVWFPMCLPSPL